MVINTFNIKADGYVFCHSAFYSAHDILSTKSPYNLRTGINELCGEIDSGNWAVSYLLSMSEHRPKDFFLFDNPVITINNKLVSLKKISELSCYMDRLYPLFSKNISVKKLVDIGLKQSQLPISNDQIIEMFQVSSDRFNRPINKVGNEIFKAMAAIGYSFNKEIFCFPWLSSMRYENFHSNLTEVLQILESLNKVVILPTAQR